MSMVRDPGYRYRFLLTDGAVVTAHPRDAKRVIDSRTPPPNESPQVVWEVLDGVIVRRLWPEDIAAIEQEPV